MREPGGCRRPAPLARALASRYPQNPAGADHRHSHRKGARARLCSATAWMYASCPTIRGRSRAILGPHSAATRHHHGNRALAQFCSRSANARRAPVLASARAVGEIGSRYRRLGRLFRGIFSAVRCSRLQTLEDAERFIAIGAQSARLNVIGNIKFDMELGPGIIDQGRELRASFWERRPTWIAGSTHAGEEEQVLAAHQNSQAKRCCCWCRGIRIGFERLRIY